MNIFDLNSLPDEMMSRIGWKARGLKQLADSKLHVPQGFVLVDINSNTDLAPALNYYANSGLSNVAVRASAACADAASFYHQGVYDSFANQQGPDQLKASIEACLKSAEQRGNGVQPAGFSFLRQPKISILIQQMIDSKISGICFAEISDGVETLVIVAKKESQTCTYKVQEKDGDFFIAGPEDAVCLSRPMIIKLTQDARHAAIELGYPITLEWMIENETICWIQASPTVTISLQNSAEFTTPLLDENSVFTSFLISDFFPSAVTPLTLSTMVKAMDKSVRQAFVTYKIIKAPGDLPESTGIVSFNNHPFFNISEIRKISEKQPEGFKEVVDITFCGEVLEESFRRCWDLSLPDFILHTTRYFSSVNNSKELDGKLKTLSEEFKIELWGKSLKWQIEEIDRNLAVLNTVFADFFKILSAASLMKTALYLIFIKALMMPDKARALVRECLSDLRDYESFDIVPALTTLAREFVLDNPRVANFDLAEMEEAFAQVNGDSKTALDRFFDEHGHRGFEEMELRSQTWQQRPSDVVRYVSTILKTNLSEVKQSARAPRYIRSIDEKFDSRNAVYLNGIIEQARSAILVCDLTESAILRVLSQFKAAYRLLGEQMVMRKLMPDADLVFFLTHEELFSFITKNDFDFSKKIVFRPDLIKIAFARKRVFPQQSATQYPSICFGEPAAKTENQDLPKNNILRGKCGSSGLSVGKARVLTSLDDLVHFKAGEIIVAEFADIGLVPYFNMAGGLITQTGSDLSSTAVIARELNLPYIIDAGPVTQMIKTGDSLSINGDSGEIKILESV